MDEKETSIATAILNDVKAGSFTDEQVELLWMKLREHVPRGSLVREFGDFVAHRPRDKGLVYKHVRKMIDAFKAFEKKKVKTLTIDYALTESVMLDDLRSQLSNLSLPVPDAAALRLLLVVSFYTMQYALLRRPSEEGGAELGRMHPYATETEIGIMIEYKHSKGALIWFRVLKVDRAAPASGVEWHRPAGPVRVKAVQGQLVVDDYEAVKQK